jgi:enamine deaminase RidA (YjgF/YER057c/UK114 family)
MSAEHDNAVIGRRGFLGAAAAAGALAGTFAPAARAQTAQPRGAVQFLTAEHFVGSGVHVAYAAKAGPFLFLNGHEAFDFDKGVVPAVAGPAGFAEYGAPPLRREADYLLERMGRVLKELGSDLAHSVRLDQYYTKPDAVRAYHLARFAAFGKYVPPSTSIIMERCFGASSNIATSLVAVMPDDQWKLEGIYPENNGVSATSGYAPAVACNDFVFAAGQMAADSAVLDPLATTPPYRTWGSALPIRAQAASAISRLEGTLKAANSSLANVVKAQIHVAGADNFPDLLDVWAERFKDSPCALTVVPSKGFATIEGIVEINLIALKNGATRKKEIIKVDLPQMASYGPVIRAGELVFASGLLPIGHDGMVAGLQQGKEFDGICLSGQLQAAAIYDQAEAIAKAAGVSMKNAVRAHYWVSDIKEFPGVALEWSGRYGAAPHPLACVVSPPMPAPGATVMADFWFYAG